MQRDARTQKLLLCILSFLTGLCTCVYEFIVTEALIIAAHDDHESIFNGSCSYGIPKDLRRVIPMVHTQASLFGAIEHVTDCKIWSMNQNLFETTISTPTYSISLKS